MSSHYILSVSILCFLIYVQVNAVRQSPPHIVKQPPTDEVLFQVATQQNENDKPFIIECEAEGEPAPEYRWMKNGKPFNWQAYDDRISQQPGRGTLVITKPGTEDLGQYQCFAKNNWGIATSNSVFVRQAELNSFKDEPPLTMAVREGDPFKLTCHPPDGWPKPNVYWLIQTSDGGIKSINSSRITLDPEGNLWFSNVTRQDASDDFTYSCTAMSVFRNEYKLGNKVVLNVIATGSSPGQNRHPPVQQYVTRKQEVALRDKKIQLFCIFGGTPLPQTVWFKNGRPLSTSDRVSQGNYGKSLIIKHVTYEDEGDYTCEASNGVGDAKSYSINLKVMAIPFFTEEPEIINAAEGETASFSCKASGNPEPAIQWIYNGKPIGEAEPNPRRTVKTHSITIERLEKTDTGNYGCNATNSLGYVYKDVYVNVLAIAPEISEPPRDEETVDNRNITMLCRVLGVPKPQIKWIRNGVELTGGRYTILESGDLHISQVGFTDMGEYTCHARNKLGEAKATSNLSVKQRTVIKPGSGPIDYEVQAGFPATFRCSAQKDESLDLSIDWLRNGEMINFDSEPRFVKSNDYSLTITKTTELDSGVYTCVASTRLDETTAQATLIVQDVPNAPKLTGVDCNLKDALVKWQPMGDNRAPILNYIIQYNTSFTPNIWDDAFLAVPAAESSYMVPLTPWSNYTFRVKARNKIGVSLPSSHSSVCRTDPDLPYKNPDNVEGRGTKPDNLVITWTPMPEIEHNAPRFHYQVFWKRNVPGSNWNYEDVLDWRQNKLEITSQPTFQPYTIKVIALNERGQANVIANEVIGYSGENIPTQAPSNFTLIEIISATSARLAWSPVAPENIHGHFKGYKIQTWTDLDGKDIKYVEVDNGTTETTINILVPNSKNFVRVLAFNGGYNGPPSDRLTIDTPEGVPGSVQSLEAYPLGSSGFYLIWKPPLQPNGLLTGYHIYYQPVILTELGPILERKPQIKDPNQTRAKLAGLQPATKYRIHINATTRAGEGAGYWIERFTRSSSSMKPNKPNFVWSFYASSDIYSSIKIFWIPDEKRSGTHFYAKYQLKGETLFEQTKPELNEDFTIVRGLKPGMTYTFSVVSLDGEFATESDPQDIDMYIGDKAVLLDKGNMLTAGWFVGLLLAIAFLIIILILVCIAKRNRGGKYIVHEQEAANRRNDYPDEPGFHEYSQPLGGAPRGARESTSSDKKQPAESDTDSLAEYGEGEAEGMNEDGSFIGLYGKRGGGKQGETSSGGFATLV